LRFGNNDGLEPLVIFRSFGGLKEPCLEISEEFRYYFNLYNDFERKILIRFDTDGEEEIVAKYSANQIQIKLDYIKKFLSVKVMSLALFFEIKRFSLLTIEDLGFKEHYKTVKRKNIRYTKSITKWASIDEDHRRALAMLQGKKILTGLKYCDPEQGLKGEPKKSENYIIGFDLNGNTIEGTFIHGKSAKEKGKKISAPYLT
jgi:hypothetical protein